MAGGERVIVCVNRRLSGAQPSCAVRGAEQFADLLERHLAAIGVPDRVQRVECLGRCDRGPNVRIAPGGRFFHGVTSGDLHAVVAALLQGTGTVCSDRGMD